MSVKGNRNKTKQKKFTHRELCFDLAEAKGSRFIEVPLGSVWLGGRSGPGQADVINIMPSYTRFNLDIYECKVSRPDFLKDVKTGKYRKYLPHCNRLYFAAPKDLLKKEEIPKGVGLIVRGDNGWTTVKCAKKRELEFSDEMLKALVFFNGRIFNRKRLDLSNKYQYRINSSYKEDLKGLGRAIKDKIVGFNKIKFLYNQLLYEAIRKIQFKNQDERDEFQIYWEEKLRRGDYF